MRNRIRVYSETVAAVLSKIIYYRQSPVTALSGFTYRHLGTIIALALLLAPAALIQVACCLQPGIGLPSNIVCGKPGDVPACVRLPII